MAFSLGCFSHPRWYPEQDKLYLGAVEQLEHAADALKFDGTGPVVLTDTQVMKLKEANSAYKRIINGTTKWFRSEHNAVIAESLKLIERASGALLNRYNSSACSVLVTLADEVNEILKQFAAAEITSTGAWEATAEDLTEKMEKAANTLVRKFDSETEAAHLADVLSEDQFKNAVKTMDIRKVFMKTFVGAAFGWFAGQCYGLAPTEQQVEPLSKWAQVSHELKSDSPKPEYVDAFGDSFSTWAALAIKFGDGLRISFFNAAWSLHGGTVASLAAAAHKAVSLDTWEKAAPSPAECSKINFADVASALDELKGRCRKSTHWPETMGAKCTSPDLFFASSRLSKAAGDCFFIMSD